MPLECQRDVARGPTTKGKKGAGTTVGAAQHERPPREGGASSDSGLPSARSDETEDEALGPRIEPFGGPTATSELLAWRDGSSGATRLIVAAEEGRVDEVRARASSSSSPLPSFFQPLFSSRGRA